MKPLLNQERYPFGSCHSGKRSIVFILFILLLSTSLFSGCSSSKKSKKKAAPVTTVTPITKTTTPTTSVTTPVTEQTVEAEVKNSALMVTFSTSNDLLKDYPHFKLGLFDIIVYVRSGDTLYKQSLYDLEPVSEAEYTSSTPLELTSLKKDSYLYHGFFNVPAGTLESVTVQFSGTKSSIALGDGVPALIDAFFFSYTEGDARLPARSYPAEVTTSVPEGFALTEDKMGMLCIDIDMNLSVGMEPLMHTDPEQKYGLFVPTISAKSMDSGFNMTIMQADLITMKDGNMGMGHPDGALFTSAYTMAESAILSVNADSVTDLNDVSGIYAIDMMGMFSSDTNGHSYVINNASMLSMAEDSIALRYEGKVTVSGDSMTLKGYQSSLKIDETSTNGSEYFSGAVVGNPTELALAEGDMAVIWSDGVASKVIMKHDAPAVADSKEVFELRSTISITPADILAVKSANKDDDTLVTLTLPESLACADYITDISTGVAKTCDSGLTAIEITRANTGMYTLVETRKGTFQTVEEAQTEGEEQTGDDTQTEEPALPELALESDIVHHFTTADEFFNALEAKVATDDYRLAVMIAEGTVDGTTFKMGSMAKAIILYPHALLDDDADGWVSGLESSIAAELASAGKSNVGLYTGVGLAAGALAALVGYVANKVVKYRQTKDLGHKLTLATVFGADPHTFYIQDGSNQRWFAVDAGEGVKVSSITVDEDGSIRAALTDASDRPVLVDGTEIDDAETVKTVKIANFDGTALDGVNIVPATDGDERTLKALFNQQVAEQIDTIKHKPLITWDKDTKSFMYKDKAITSIELTVEEGGTPRIIDFTDKKGTLSDTPDGIKLRALTQGVLPTTLFSYDADGSSSKYHDVKIFQGVDDVSRTLTDDLVAKRNTQNEVIEKAKAIRALQNNPLKKFDPRKVFTDTTTKIYNAAAQASYDSTKTTISSVRKNLASKVSGWFDTVKSKFRRKGKTT